MGGPQASTTPSPRSTGQGGSGPYSGRVVVRLVRELAYEDASTLQELAERRGLEGLAQILDKYVLGPSRRLLCPKSLSYLEELESNAEAGDYRPLQPLAAFWRLDLRHKPRKLHKIIRRLSELYEVGYAYAELAAEDPAAAQSGVNYGDDPLATGQGYLGPAPVGIDAHFAWMQDNGRGEGVQIIDLEQGWLPKQEDLAPADPAPIEGSNRHGIDGYVGHHGAAVLGLLEGSDNAVGMVGVAPGIAALRTASHFIAASTGASTSALSAKATSGQVANAIVAAIAELSPGDILLLEVQRAFLPTEVDEADFHAIRLAVAHGIVVVEAAGNGGFDLDAFRDEHGQHIFDRRAPRYQDSGAILVGSADRELPHDRSPASNFGSRVDCHAWGDGVVSVGYGDLPPASSTQASGAPADLSRSYTGVFANTSASAAIIAGAAALLQGRYRAATGGRLSPSRLRALFADITLGTPQGRGVGGWIGSMPDLRAILRDALGITPRLYLRAEPGDWQAPGRARAIGHCPDIFLGPSSSQTQGQAQTGEELIYSRVANRGMGAAACATLTAYWSEVATLVTPDRWRRIGTSKGLDVPQGNRPVDVGPIAWKRPPTLNDEGVCLIGVVDHPQDPAPALPAMSLPSAAVGHRGEGDFDWEGFLSLIQNADNIAFNNRHRVQPRSEGSSGTASGSRTLPFWITGSPAGDRERRFGFEILHGLPIGAEVWLEVPLLLGVAMGGGQGLDFEVDSEGRRIRLRLPALPRLPFCWVRLAAGARHRARFFVEGPEGLIAGGHRLAIRQLYGRQEVGRITWDFKPH